MDEDIGNFDLSDSFQQESTMEYNRFSEMSSTNRTEVGDSVLPTSTDQDTKARQITRFQKPSEAFIAASIRNKDDARLIWDRTVMKWLKGGLKNYNEDMPFRPYLVTVLKNEIRKFFREFAKNREYDILDETIVTQKMTEGQKAFDGECGKLTLREALESVRCDIDELSKAHEYVVEFTRENGREPTAEEIAFELGITPEAARAQKSRSQRRIRRQVIKSVSEELKTRGYHKVEEELEAQGLLAFCKDELVKMRDACELND